MTSCANTPRPIHAGRYLSIIASVAAIVASSGATARDMTFRPVIVAGARAVEATGRIAATTPGAFLKVAPMRSAIVYLDSPGGSVASAMRLGELFRRRGSVVIVARLTSNGADGWISSAGNCFSACVYAMMGGRSRIVPEGSRVGIHEMAPMPGDPAPSTASASRRLRADHAAMSQDLKDYASRMGVDASLVDAAEATLPGSLRILSQQELRGWQFTVPQT